MLDELLSGGYIKDDLIPTYQQVMRVLRSFITDMDLIHAYEDSKWSSRNIG
jgi:hypothetical protein